MAQLILITATVARTWRLEQAPGSNDTTRVGITLRPHRLLLRPVPR
jgi:epi-isozizaene 5-monooxygenase